MKVKVGHLERGSTEEKRNTKLYIDRTVGSIDKHTEILGRYESISNVDDLKKMATVIEVIISVKSNGKT